MEHALGLQVLEWLSRWSTGPGAGPVQHAMLAIYRLTGKGMMPVLVGLALMLLARRRLWAELTLVAVACGGIFVLVDLVLKPLIERPRPPGALLLIDGSSFPSGHAAGAVVFSLVLAAVASRHRPDHARLAFGLSAGWIALVGLSTLVVRAHWPSDVLGGYAVGLAWVTLCLTVWRHRSRRR